MPGEDEVRQGTWHLLHHLFNGMQPIFTKQNMWSLLQEALFVAGFIFTAYAALQSSPPKTEPPAAAVRFFPLTSLVTDFYHGDLGNAFNHVMESEISFVFYYAPWNAECQRVKWEFQKTARLFHDKVTFIAINCWHPNGECKRHFAKIMSYPVLILYPYSFGGIEYKGIKESSYLAAFLQNALKPVTRVQQPKDLRNLLVKGDAVLLGFFNFTAKSRNPFEYISFFTTAWRALERDPVHNIKFSVITSQSVAHRFGITVDKTIQLHLWNETWTFPRNASITPGVLIKWAYSKAEFVASWLSPSGKKSRLLASIVDNSPILILFTPRYPHLQESSYYYMLKEVAIEYYTCNSSAILAHWTAQRRLSLRKKFIEWEQDCEQWLQSKVDIGDFGQPFCSNTNDSCCRSIDFPSLSQLKQICEICVHRAKKSFSEQDILCQTLYEIEEQAGILEQMQRVWLGLEKNCEKQLLQYHPFKRSSRCCIREEEPASRREADLDNPDERIQMLLESVIDNKCKTLYHSKVQGEFYHAKDGKLNEHSIVGLGCSTNNTLTFVAMDSLMYHSFPESLGFTLNEDKAAAVIFDKFKDEYYVYDTDITKAGVREFIWKYTYGEMPRYLKSKISPVTPSDDQSIHLLEVTSKTFHQVVMDPNRDVVLFYYTPWCGLCLPASTVLLNVAHVFAGVGNVTFARVDASSNDLPWHFTMDSYPTIILFPAYRKADSRLFPTDKAVTVPNLLNFLMSNMQATVRLELLLKTCGETCIDSARVSILGKIRYMLTKYRTLSARFTHAAIYRDQAQGPIDTSFQYMSILKGEMSDVVNLLRHLNTVHLMLATNPLKNKFGSLQAETILESFRAYEFDKRRRRSKEMDT